MVKRNIKWLLVVLVLGLCPSILHAEDPYGEMKALADSAQKVLGQDRLPSINARWIKLARELNDTVQISDAHNNLISHYYQLGYIDHLKACLLDTSFKINSRSALSFSTLRFISVTKLLPFLEELVKKPKLFSYV